MKSMKSVIHVRVHARARRLPDGGGEICAVRRSLTSPTWLTSVRGTGEVRM